MAITHTSGFRPRIYTESPWYEPVAKLLARFDADCAFPTPELLTALYAERVSGLDLPPLRFVTAHKTKKPRGRAQPIVLGTLYEGRIIEHAEVPTRPDDWHDLFNALAFITYPRAKRVLHLRQYTLLRARIAPGATRLPNARTREQDALSLFDEGGIALALAPGLDPALLAEGGEPLHAAIAEGKACALPFGHALYEHMAAGLACPLGTLHGVTLASGAMLDALDAALARELADPTRFRLPSSARGVALTELTPRFELAW
jgi:hypothetical protein